jgi:hypothetical protein
VANEHLLSLHDILVAWQAGEISYRTALDLTQIDTLDELYQAAALSGVALRTNLTADEKAMAEIVAPLIRRQRELDHTARSGSRGSEKPRSA